MVISSYTLLVCALFSPQIFKQVPEIDLSVEREGYSHAFCCSEAASIYIAQYVASLVKKHLSD